FALLLMVSSVIAEHPPESQSSKTPRQQVNSAGDRNPDSGRDSNGGEPTAPAIGPDLVCDALVSSAQANGLPITFFSNLIWQESRFVAHAVSRAGALGIAQFMPATAAAVGLKNPLDPLQALPASARLLGNLNRKFGNLGLAAAAYNAGDRAAAHQYICWRQAPARRQRKSPCTLPSSRQFRNTRARPTTSQSRRN